VTLKEIRDWLKPMIPGITNAYIGKTDPKQEKSICIYSRPSDADRIAVGGLVNTSTATKSISILVQWSKNCDTTETQAKSIYDIFNGKRSVINGVDAFFRMKNNEPIPVGTNDNDIYEYVIDLTITYKRG
jgi:hypothetical protein